MFNHPYTSHQTGSWRRLGTLLLLALLSAGTHAQVLLTEVYGDGSFQLTNTGTTNASIGTYWICNFPSYQQLQNLTVECGGLNLAPGEYTVLSGFDGDVDPADSELGLYLNQGFSDPNSIVSYVEWGPSEHARSSVAAAAGIWTNDQPNPAGFDAGASIYSEGSGIQPSDWNINPNPVVCAVDPLQEARSIVELGAQEAGRTVADFNGSTREFPTEFANFLPSVIALDDLTDPTLASAVLPLYEGVGPNGEPTYFIITEATSIELAEEYGAILSPKLRYGAEPAAADAAQRVEVVDGRIYFLGDVDFSPERIVEAGSPTAFPPAFVQPGAVGDDQYSSLVVLPSGEVINAQIVANATGVHDRIVEYNLDERWARFQLLDGWESDRRFYYHLVTDASAPGPAAIELGVYAPRLANLPTFGNSELDGESVLLGFAPNANGLTIAEDNADETNRQGLSSTILDNDLDPVNVFPFDPTNDIEDGNNYSPMWDAHITMWTDDAINGPNGDQRRAITSFADMFQLLDDGLLVDFAGNNGAPNPFMNGLMPTNAVINCPVICHPFQGSGTEIVLSPLEEARTIVELGAQEAGRTVADFNGSDRSFDEEDQVFLPSAISVDSLPYPGSATTVLPLYEGVGPNGEPTYFIITEATTIELAEEYGAILSPKLRYGANPAAAAAAQRVQVDNGRVIFQGDVDFSPERIVEAGSPTAFPPAFVQPGAVGDDQYSSLVVLPSGEVINAQIVANATGVHDRIVEYNLDERWARFQLLDGWESDRRFYYHLVTDASAPGPAAIELGVYAPRLANLPTFGNSELDGESVLLGFAPNANGLTIAEDNADETNRQGLSSTILDNDLDPVNVFPFDPTNDIEDGNNYSPMWDAHITMWTDDAINGPNGDQRRAITSFADMFQLLDDGLLVDFAGNNGAPNPFMNGLMPTNAVINCPVVAHPFVVTDVNSPALCDCNFGISPNPAKGTATFDFSLPAGGEVSVTVYNVLGRPVAQPLRNADRTAGDYRETWNANGLPSGHYFAVLRLDDRIQTVRFVLQ